MVTDFDYYREVELFPPADSLKLAAIDISGPLLRTKAGIPLSSF